jgi:hypothetical protein
MIGLPARNARTKRREQACSVHQLICVFQQAFDLEDVHRSKGSKHAHKLVFQGFSRSLSSSNFFWITSPHFATTRPQSFVIFAIVLPQLVLMDSMASPDC